MLYLLERSHLAQRDLEKSKIALASYGRPFLPKLSFCYCALYFLIVPCHGEAPRKSGVKKFPALCAGICAPIFEMDVNICNAESYIIADVVYAIQHEHCYLKYTFILIILLLRQRLLAMHKRCDRAFGHTNI